jgi:hypothetical protein
MAQLKKELLIATLVVSFVGASLFSPRLPVVVQSVLFLFVLLLGFFMIVAGWWCWSIVRTDGDVPRWRKVFGLSGVIANSLALAIPFVALSCITGIDWGHIAAASLICSSCGLIAGLIAPREIRLPTALAGLITGSIILSIPIGVL